MCTTELGHLAKILPEMTKRNVKVFYFFIPLCFVIINRFWAFLAMMSTPILAGSRTSRSPHPSMSSPSGCQRPEWRVSLPHYCRPQARPCREVGHVGPRGEGHCGPAPHCPGGELFFCAPLTARSSLSAPTNASSCRFCTPPPPAATLSAISRCHASPGFVVPHAS